MFTEIGDTPTFQWLAIGDTDLRHSSFTFTELKKIGIALLVVLHITVVFRSFIPWLSYHHNFDYIATVLCVNVSRPAMKCDGFCHLKMMADMENDHHHESNTETRKSETDLFHPQFHLIEINPSEPQRFVWDEAPTLPPGRTVVPPTPPPKFA